MKKRPHAKPDKLGRGQHGRYYKLKAKSNHIGLSKHKNSYLKADHGG